MNEVCHIPRLHVKYNHYNTCISNAEQPSHSLSHTLHRSLQVELYFHFLWEPKLKVWISLPSKTPCLTCATGKSLSKELLSFASLCLPLSSLELCRSKYSGVAFILCIGIRKGNEWDRLQHVWTQGGIGEEFTDTTIHAKWQWGVNKCTETVHVGPRVPNKLQKARSNVYRSCFFASCYRR